MRSVPTPVVANTIAKREVLQAQRLHSLHVCACRDRARTTSAHRWRLAGQQILTRTGAQEIVAVARQRHVPHYHHSDRDSMDPTLLAPNRFEHTFLGLPASNTIIAGSVSIMGAVHGTAYENSGFEGTGLVGPDAVRRAINAASVHIDHWDFDFDGPLLNRGALRAYDLGNLHTARGANATNRNVIEAATRHVRAGGSIPVLIGGDDSVAIPFMRALGDVEALHILQVDAHIDWRDRIGDEAQGYSSTMRRASELGFVRSMTQVGIRAVGSARQDEIEAARAWGSRLITVRQARRQGLAEIAKTIPQDGELLIHIDCDALDPSLCPGVNALSPGGLFFDEVTDLIRAALQGRRLAGFSIVEFNPAHDVNAMTATVVGRLVCHILGNLARPFDRRT